MGPNTLLPPFWGGLPPKRTHFDDLRLRCIMQLLCSFKINVLEPGRGQGRKTLHHFLHLYHLRTEPTDSTDGSRESCENRREKF